MMKKYRFEELKEIDPAVAEWIYEDFSEELKQDELEHFIDMYIDMFN